MDFNMKDEQDWEREQHVDLQVQALHREINHKRFTIEVISTIHHQLFGPTSENSINKEIFNKEIFNRYIGTLGADEKHRLSCELEIFGSAGQISSYFVRGQELNTFAVEEMIQIVKEWTETCQRATGALSLNKEAFSSELLYRLDGFKMTRRFEHWTREILKDLRWALARKGSDLVREKRQDEAKAVQSKEKQDSLLSGDVLAGEIRGKRKLSFDSDDEGQESKRAREFNDLYDSTPERKRNPRANVERGVGEKNTMDLN